MRKGDIVLTKNGEMFKVVGLPLVPDDLMAVQFIDREEGSLIDLDKFNIEDTSNSFGSKLLFASQRKLHERLNRLGKV